MANYTENQAFQDEMRVMNRYQQEGVITGLWNLILNIHFPSSEDFVHRPQHGGKKGGSAGYTDIESSVWNQHHRAKSRRPTRFLVTQCKRFAKVGQDSGWADGVRQMNVYLGDIASSSKGRKYGIYGIIAIGKHVRFYEWDRKNKMVVDLGSGQPYHVKDDSVQVLNFLNMIKQNHRYV
ncbi:uncharacterized protein BO87DRAFT_428132 [Aspergillus neoniger CBS 115656]|uniref:Fungal-type protein kinase domain-containing protein n=1 Tax=Aspergillus neoniger (strain CBS 115656) TaxID=1448310 RepID=A0A318YD18_ASPNB|nr:hypothetical protein BO87DRAFT_428132 [Aspergillus neoniger CBS 115656]PYH31894.1 hypothetical protein BO87DRAFT_428132 [Aspergillus neoniger CBS 115656]